MFAFLKSRWFKLLLAMAAMTAILALATAATDNSKLDPAVIFYGAAAGPLAVLMAVQDRTGIGRSVPAATLLGMFLFGGGAGLLIGGVVDIEIIGDSNDRLWLVGFIEESAKMAPVVAVALTGRYLTKASGVALGLASAAGFAVMESSGYGLSELQEGGSIIQAGELALARGFLEPFTHLAWTGLLCAVAFSVWERKGKVVVTWSVAGIFLVAALLHSANDTALIAAKSVSPGFMALYPLIMAASLYLFIRSIRDLRIHSHLRSE